MIKKVLFKTEKNGLCNRVTIPNKYCTIILKNQLIDFVEVSKNGNDVMIEVINSKLKCQKC